MTMWISRSDIEEASEAKYQAIARAIAGAVERGELAPGDRLPTHREMAGRLGVTVGTVTRAYQEAARRGLVDGQVGRGTFVRDRSRPRSGFGTPDPGGDGVVRLGMNLPTPLAGGLEEKELARVLGELAREDGATALVDSYRLVASEYQRSAGVELAARVGLEADPEGVVITAGAQHGITVALSALTQPGGRVLTEALTYPGVKSAARALNLRLGSVAMDDEGVLPDAFEEACARGDADVAYLIPTLQNPTNGTLSVERRKALARIAGEHGVVIVEDDVHGLLPESPAPPIASFAPDQVCYLQSVSKSLAPGLRTAYLHAPPPLRERLHSAVRTTMWMATPLMSEITARWVHSGAADRILEARRAESRARHAIAVEVLEGLEYRDDPMALHVWLELPDPWRSNDFAEQLAQRGVVVAEAESFAACRDEVPHAVRIGLSPARNREELREALTAVRELLAGCGDPMLQVV